MKADTGTKLKNHKCITKMQLVETNITTSYFKKALITKSKWREIKHKLNKLIFVQ